MFNTNLLPGRVACHCTRCAQSDEGQCRYPGISTSVTLICAECEQICNDLPGRRDGH